VQCIKGALKLISITHIESPVIKQMGLNRFILILPTLSKQILFQEFTLKTVVFFFQSFNLNIRISDQSFVLFDLFSVDIDFGPEL
jgi:hypothetical protein